MKKFLVISIAVFCFGVLLPVAAEAQSCRWRGGRSYTVREYRYTPAYSYNRRYRRDRYRGYDRRRDRAYRYAVARYRPVITYSRYRPVRRYVYYRY